MQDSSSTAIVTPDHAHTHAPNHVPSTHPPSGQSPPGGGPTGGAPAGGGAGAQRGVDEIWRTGFYVLQKSALTITSAETDLVILRLGQSCRGH